MAGDRGRGEGEIFQKTYRDKTTGEIRTQATWSIRYYDAEGTRHEESSGSTDRRKAVALLNQRLNDARHGIPVGVGVNRTTFAKLVEIIRNDYKVNARDSVDRLEGSLAHLCEVFDGCAAVAISEDRIEAYKAFRIDEGAKNATINRELAALKRMFRLGWRLKKVGRIPHIEMLEEDNRRKGFFEPEQFRLIRSKLKPALRELADVAYITGWRVASEILTLQWHKVDFGPQVWGCCGESCREDSCSICGKARPGWLRLDPGDAKNKEARHFPLTLELRAALWARRQLTDILEKATGETMPWVFWRTRGAEHGRVKSWRGAWKRACADAGLGQVHKDSEGKTVKVTATRIPHDFRRTAVRNLELAGVDRSTAMALVGHKTEAIYRRYAIVDAEMMKRGAAKLSALHQEQTTTKNVTPFRKRGGEKA